MNKKQQVIIVIVLALLALLIVACGGADGTTEGTPAAAEPQVVEVTRIVTEVITETVEIEGETVEVTRIVEVPVEEAAEEQAEPGADEPVTITFWGTERGRDTASTRELHFQLARAFEETHPNTTVAVSLFPSGGFGDRVLTAIAAGEGPDIWYHFWAADIATQGFLEDLTPYIEASGFDPNERWFPVGNVRAVHDGRYYGLPRDATAGVIAYNMDLFDAAGVPYPEDGWTIADYREKAIALTDQANDQYGIGAIVGSPGCFQWSSFSYNMGAEFVSPDGRQVEGFMDSPEAVEAINYCLGLTAEDQVAAPPGMQEQFGELVFLSGNVAMQHVSTWELAALNEQATFNWGVVAPPRANEDTEGVAWTDAYVFYMNAESARKQRAWEFLEWITGPEAGRMIAESGVWTPALPEIWQEMGWDQDPILSVFWNELNKETRVPNYLRSQFYFDCVGSIFDDVWTRYTELGERDVAAMVAELVPPAQDCLDDSYADLEG